MEGRYEIKNCIGRGSYGDVFLGCVRTHTCLHSLTPTHAPEQYLRLGARVTVLWNHQPARHFHLASQPHPHHLPHIHAHRVDKQTGAQVALKVIDLEDV